MKGNSSFEAEKGIKCFDNMYLYVFLVYPMTVSKRRVIIHRLKGWERRILVVNFNFKYPNFYSVSDD